MVDENENISNQPYKSESNFFFFDNQKVNIYYFKNTMIW